MSWEDLKFALAGPRKGKTRALAVDTLCTGTRAHPGHGAVGLTG